MADGFDVVAVGVTDERGVVTGVVLRPELGLVQHLAASDPAASAAEPGGGWAGNGVANGDSAHTAGGYPQEGLGLAVIAGLADDVQFTRTPAGLSIRMSWPSGGTGG